MKVERWNNDTSRGWSLAITLWCSSRHRWKLYLERDRVHRNGNHLVRLEFVRSTRPFETEQKPDTFHSPAHDAAGITETIPL